MTAENEQKSGWFKRLTQGLTRTTSNLTGGITAIFTKKKLDRETLEALEELLIRADLGVDAAAALTQALAKDRFGKEVGEDEIREALAGEIEKVLAPIEQPLTLAETGLTIILVVGVNGTGKTTTIGKLARDFTAQGRRVMLAAGDTFRAAAIEQLTIWGARNNVPVVAGEAGADAAGLAFDACARARTEGMDVLLIDTAGRLQNKAGLMAELEKIIRVIRKHDPAAPHRVLLTLDATTGQNALSQADVFREVAGVTGLVMTKLDGTAKGGILVALARRFGLPVHWIGVGEGIGDLQPFSARAFARALVGLPS